MCDDELAPAPAAGARGRAPDARRRPHDRHPRHLRPARPHRRGQAPGRARPARVLDAAHARHVAAPRAAGRRRRHPRPGRDPARVRPADRPPPGRAPQGAARGGGRSARRDAARAHAKRDADGGARGIHERRQVDAPERPHRLGRARRRPALRDARPDDPRVSRGGPRVPRDRHGRVHPQAAARARRGLRGHARGDARGRPHPARGRRLGRRGRACREQLAEVRGGARRHRAPTRSRTCSS